MPEASPKKVGKFILAILLGLAIFLIVAMTWIFFQGHKPSMMKNSSLPSAQFFEQG